MPKQNTVFKSSINRFADPKTKTPGPGTYQYQKPIARQIQKQKRSQTINMVQNIKEKARYSFVPSVPDKFKKYGYTDLESTPLSR